MVTTEPVGPSKVSLFNPPASTPTLQRGKLRLRGAGLRWVPLCQRQIPSRALDFERLVGIEA